MEFATRCPAPDGASPTGKSWRLGVSAFLTAMSLACRADDGFVPELPTPVETVPPVAAAYGTVKVMTATVGADLDSDGFWVQVDGAWDYSHVPTQIATNGTVMLRGVTAGNHTLTLYEISANCSGQNLIDRPIVVTANAVTVVEFQVACRDSKR